MKSLICTLIATALFVGIIHIIGLDNTLALNCIPYHRR